MIRATAPCGCGKSELSRRSGAKKNRDEAADDHRQETGIGPREPNPPYCCLMPALLTTFAHFATSLRTKAANSSGDLLTWGSAPSLISCLRTDESPTARENAPWMREITSLDVPVGTKIPNHWIAR